MNVRIRCISITVFLVVVGLGLRGYHYGRNPSVWCDENGVMMNAMQKGYLALCGRLSIYTAAPPLFMWMEKASNQLFGDSPYSFRLPPFVASLLALVLLAWVAHRCLPPAAIPWAVFLFAVSDKLLWHACEAKPYSLDVLCATLLLVVYLLYRQRPVYQQCLAFLVVTPFVIFGCFPGGFLMGGVLCAMLLQVWRGRRLQDWAALGALSLVVAVCFLGMMVGPVRNQRADIEIIADTWYFAFPDYTRPWLLPWWTVCKLFDVPRYCMTPTGGFLLPIIITGGVWVWHKDRSLLALFTVPLGLALAAAFMKNYPFGYARVEAYGAPALILLTAVGFWVVWNYLRSRMATVTAWPSLYGHRRTLQIGCVLLTLLMLYPGVLTAWRVVHFWDRNDSDKATAYVLAHCRPDDGVQYSMWEYEYYFRQHRTLVEHAHEASVPRVWLISASLNGQDLDSALRNWPASQWHVEQVVSDFRHIKIFLLARARPSV